MKVVSRTNYVFKSTDDVKNDVLIKEILADDEFEQIEDNGEIIYLNTRFDAHACIKYEFSGDEVKIEGWVKTFPLAPINRKKFKEHELKGFSAGAPKKLCRKTIERIEKSIV